MRDVALKIPLAALAVGRLFQRHDAGAAGIGVFHEAFDGAPLAGGVTPLEQNDHFLAGLAHPFLDFEQLDLEVGFTPLIDGALNFIALGIGPLAEQILDHRRIMAPFRRPGGGSGKFGWYIGFGHCFW